MTVYVEADFFVTLTKDTDWLQESAEAALTGVTTALAGGDLRGERGRERRGRAGPVDRSRPQRRRAVERGAVGVSLRDD